MAATRSFPIRSAMASILLVTAGGGAACGTSGDGSTGPGDVDSGDQDPFCHKHALTFARQTVPDFEWNESGMEVYLAEYDACMEVAGFD